MTEKIEGVVKRAILPRGFGFVDGDDGLEYFLHADDLLPGQQWGGELVRPGVRVEFEPERTGRGGSGLRARGWRAL